MLPISSQLFYTFDKKNILLKIVKKIYEKDISLTFLLAPARRDFGSFFNQMKEINFFVSSQAETNL